MTQDGHDSFAEALTQRAAEKRAEYSQLVQQRRRLDVRIVRMTEYLDKLNEMLQAEDLRPIRLGQVSGQSNVGKPGNRAKGMPVRRVEWGGMTLTEIANVILNRTDDSLHADVIIEQVYEIESNADKKKAKLSIVSTLRRGAEKGLWQSHPKNHYQGINQQAPMELNE